MNVAPLLILLVGILTVVGMIVVFRINAFLALITAAIVVSVLAPGAWEDKIVRVATAFGATTGSIGIVIAMAAVIGVTMMASGAADRVVQAFLRLLGQERGGIALMGSGFVLSVPVFFDTVFYLLVPLARSTYRQTGRNYLKFLMAIAAGGAATHSLVPPTPGPLVIADNLGIDLGVMMLVGALVAFPAATVGLLFAGWIDRRMPVPMRPLADIEEDPPLESRLPGLWASLMPIILPVVLITGQTVTNTLAGGSGSVGAQLAQWMAVFGNPNLALLLAAAVSVWVYVRHRKPTREKIAHLIEQSLMSGGIIILITAGGGAFGAMLKEAQIGPAIQEMFAGSSQNSGMVMLALGFGIASLLKFAQGSSTVAMITASAMLAAMVTPGSLGFHTVYLGTVIGSGALVGSWMNDSGFWIFSKMGGLTEMETLKSWSPLLAVLGITGAIVSVILALILPLT